MELNKCEIANILNEYNVNYVKASLISIKFSRNNIMQFRKCNVLFNIPRQGRSVSDKRIVKGD